MDGIPPPGGERVRILITGRHVEMTDEVRQYVYDKVGRLSKYYDRIHETEVILDHESEQFRVEMIVRADRKHTFVASGTGPDTFVLIDAIADKLERQLTKHKEKNRTRKGGIAADGNSAEG
jgi:putative sigma-54 modulation protein